jgi:hypothetical protein
VVWGGTISLPQIAFYAIAGLALISTLMLASTIMGMRSNAIIKAISEANKKDKRLVMMHFANGQNKLVVPVYIQPEETDGQTSPYWLIDGTYRFKDATGEKWETLGNLKLLHYTARTTSAISTDQAAAIDQFNDLLSKYTFSSRGFLKEFFFMIQESAKGSVAEQAAWQKIRTRTAVHTQNKIKEMLDFIKEHPEIRYVMLKSGAFTYKTAVSVVDQLVSNGVTYLSHTISFVEDRTRRKLNDKFDSLMKWVIIIVPIIFAVAIGAVIFLVGTGMVGGKGI